LSEPCLPGRQPGTFPSAIEFAAVPVGMIGLVHWGL
jgi:hypothetical protein